jgi:hypothetical protein
MRKMNVNEQRELDYYNHEEHNRFRGLVEFPTVYCIKLANVLCKDEEMVQRYMNEYYSTELEQWEVINSLKKYKTDILNERIIDIDEYRDKIKSCIKIANWSLLWVVLQDLFLEYLAKEQIDSIVELIHKSINEEDIINWYEKGKKILAITTFGVDYIQGI